MRVLPALLGFCSLLPGQPIRVDITRNEIWLTRNPESSNPQANQLTHDGRTKVLAEPSSWGDRIAYYEECVQGEGCTPSVVILDLEGKRLQTFQPRFSALGSPDEPCAAILKVAWLRGGSAMAIECHVNPSLSEYTEIDLKTGGHIRDLAGFGFTPSPDGKLVAHVGPLVHFAPPFAKSYFLLLDNAVVYPLRKGAKPIALKPDEWPASDEVVQKRGASYIGIHEFTSEIAWSQDSSRVAFIDCVFDWVVTAHDRDGREVGDERNRRCSLAAVSVTGTFTVLSIQDVPLESIYRSDVLWIDDHQVQVEFSAESSAAPPSRRIFKLP